LRIDSDLDAPLASDRSVCTTIQRRTERKWSIWFRTAFVPSFFVGSASPADASVLHGQLESRLAVLLAVILVLQSFAASCAELLRNMQLADLLR
jgi:hypothetical protein